MARFHNSLIIPSTKILRFRFTDQTRILLKGRFRTKINTRYGHKFYAKKLSNDLVVKIQTFDRRLLVQTPRLVVIPHYKLLICIEEERIEARDVDYLDVDFDGEYFYFDSFSTPAFNSYWSITYTNITPATWRVLKLYPFMAPTVFGSETVTDHPSPYTVLFFPILLIRKKQHRRKWLSWLGSEHQTFFMQSLFSLLIYSLRINISGAGYFSEILDQKTVVLVLGLSHDFLIQLPASIFCGFLDAKRINFTLWSYDRIALINYAVQLCNYRRINAYQLCGLRIQHQYFKKKPGKKKFAK